MEQAVDRNEDHDRAERAASAEPAGDASPNDFGAERRIVEAAFHEFAEKGFAGARVDEICRRAEVSRQLLYYYYRSKQGLYDAVLRRIVDIYFGSQGQSAADETFAEGILRYARMPELADRARWRRMWVWEALEGLPDELVREDERASSWRHAIEKVRMAQERGEIDPRLDPELLTLALEGVIHLPYILPQITKLVSGLFPDDPRYGRRREDFLELLFELLAPRGGDLASGA